MPVSKKNNSIAIVGMSCVFPGAHSPEELWNNVLAGRRFFRTLPNERLPKADYYDPDPLAPGKSYNDKIAVIDGWSFAPLDYRIPPITAYGTDIVHWLALDNSRKALLNSGLNLSSDDKASTGVIIGNSLGGEFGRSHYLRFRWPYVERSIRRSLENSGADESYILSLIHSVKTVYESPLPEINEDSLAGNMSNTLSGRICNFFDFGGGGFTVDGACSSSLLSVAYACESLINGNIKFALAGGVDVSLDAFEIVGFAKTKALSKSDIKPYDENADGMLTGEGCGIFVLMREEDAKEKGLEIHALIKGWGISSDGAGALTAPEVEGQIRALRRAYDRAGYNICSVGLIEGHGTGTPVGDAVELSALIKLIEENPGKNPCLVGSIKANIGHCKAAAGSAGLIKSVMSLKRKIIPPFTNCNNPHSIFQDSQTVLRPTLDGEIWKKEKTPRRASVSAMGFGGINTHVTLEEANPKSEICKSDIDILKSKRQTELIVLSDSSIDNLISRLQKLLQISEKFCQADLTDLAAAMAMNEAEGPFRISFVISDQWNFSDCLKKVLSSLNDNKDLSLCNEPDAGIFAGIAKENPKWAALFPGQGSQFLNMGRQLIKDYSFAESFFSKADKKLKSLLPEGLSTKFLSDPFTEISAVKQKKKELNNTMVAQPSIAAVSAAVLELLNKIGLEPSAVLGHSLGEIPALQAAGVFNGINSVCIAAERAVAMSSLEGDSGGMSAVFASPDSVKSLLEKIDGYLVIANYNSPNQTVVSGAISALDSFEQKCGEKGLKFRRLNVSNAFHSNLVQEAAGLFADKLENFKLRKPKIPFFSCVTGSQIDSDTDIISLLAKQICAPVKFTDAFAEICKIQPDFFVEVGPGSVLSGLVKANSKGNFSCFQTNLKDADFHFLIQKIVAQAFVSGFNPKLKYLFENRFFKPFSIDEYNPEFITNPCERELTEPIPKVNLTGNYLTGDGFNPQYLIERGDFLKELIAVDYKHWADSKKLPVKTENDEMRSAPADSSADEPDSFESLLDYSIDWISKRTGFPKDSIQPDMKLRDDLNLDSIKVGEFVYNVSKRLNKQVPSDPSGYANARLSKLLDVIKNDFKDADGSRRLSNIKGVTGKTAVQSLAEWIRNFEIDFVEAPIGREMFLRMPARGDLYLIGDPKNSVVKTFANKIERHGIKSTLIDFDDVDPDAPSPENVSMMVCFLPESYKNIFECSPSDFHERTKKYVELLFNSFKWITKNLDPSWSNFRCVVVRTYNVDSQNSNADSLPYFFDEDLDAGKAFLRTLQREHTSFHAKWLTLPDTCSPEQISTIIEKELQTSGRRVYYAYAKNGNRFTQAAVPADSSSSNELVLNSDDLVLCTGGAKGITFEIAKSLAMKSGAGIALIGRSTLKRDSDDELSFNLNSLDQNNIDYIYVQSDINDLESLKLAVKKIESEKRKITGIIHGAGITELRLFNELSIDQFFDVFNVKVRGFFNLINSVNLNQLKLFHALSSVLGHTGMAGQTDYTTANAWLDAAVKQLKFLRPEINCLSIGYTIWSETGIGKKIGAVDSLHASGTVPATNKDGVEGYLALAELNPKQPVFAVTGRLNDDIDPNLFPPLPETDFRFLENVLRYVPKTECVTEAFLDCSRDWYLKEHIFQNMLLLPGVIAIEAMTQAAQFCIGTSEIPSFQNIEFKHAVVVPEDAGLTLRTLVLAEPAVNGVTKVKAVVCVDSDDYQVHHFTADLFFGEIKSCPDYSLQDVEGVIDKDPEDFFPNPLFQGKFFRRISKIKKIDFENEVICEIVIPQNENYFSAEFSNATAMPYPAARDAFLHSGILALPPNSLPSVIGRLTVFKTLKPGETAHAFGKVIEKIGDDGRLSNMIVFDSNGVIVEIIENVVTKIAADSESVPPPARAEFIPAERIESDFNGLLADYKIAFAFADLEEVKSAPEISHSDLVIFKKIPEPRRNSALAGLIAVRRAAQTLASKLNLNDFDPCCVYVQHDNSGAPSLSFNNKKFSGSFDGFFVSIADCSKCAVAVVADRKIGVDIEPVESRDAETWRALLGDDGYDEALNVQRKTHENFDSSASRVWALLEASKKAHDSRRILPLYDSSRGSSWHSSSSVVDGKLVENLSSLTSFDSIAPSAFAVSIPTLKSQFDSENAVLREFNAAVNDLRLDLRKMRAVCANDPDNPDSDKHRLHINNSIKNAIERFKQVERALKPSKLYDLRKQVFSMFKEFADGTEIVSHAVDKPYGYIGDFMMLEKLIQNNTNAKGLAFQIDSVQLEHPGSVATRNRVDWVVNSVKDYINRKKSKSINILDIGIGSAPVERRLLDEIPGLELNVTGLDIEPAALAFVEEKLENKVRKVELKRVDLRASDAADAIADFAADIDVCVAIGIVEALRDEEILNVFSSLFNVMPKGSILFVESYRPDHPTRPYMEWFMDYHLGYRSGDEIVELMVQSGADPNNIKTEIELTGSLSFVTIYI